MRSWLGFLTVKLDASLGSLILEQDSALLDVLQSLPLKIYLVLKSKSYWGGD